MKVTAPPFMFMEGGDMGATPPGDSVICRGRVGPGSWAICVLNYWPLYS